MPCNALTTFSSCPFQFRSYPGKRPAHPDAIWRRCYDLFFNVELMENPNTRHANRRIMFDTICVACLIAYFRHLALPALRGGFREDEMMNMGICWRAGALKSLLANIVFWKV